MEPLKVLHRGFDGLDVAYEGYLQTEALDVLETAKVQAQKEMREILVAIGPGKCEMHVAETGARGGYAYRCDTGPLGETWFFKRRLSIEPGNIRASVKSLPLALFGLEGVKQRLAERLAAMGATVRSESVGRLDYAVDLLLPSEFELRPDQFVTHSRARVAEENYPLEPQRIAPGEFGVVWSGRKASSVTIGKMPGRQIIVYDKRREAIQKGKPHWFRIWDIPQSDKSHAIWRVEVRAGKKHLKEDSRITTFADLDRKIRKVFLDALSVVRYLRAPRPEGNVSRCPDHPIWHAVCAEVSRCLKPQLPDIPEGEITDAERRRFADRQWKMIEGLIPGALVAEGYSDEEAAMIAPTLLSDLAESFARKQPNVLRKKLARARHKLRFFESPPTER